MPDLRLTFAANDHAVWAAAAKAWLVAGSKTGSTSLAGAVRLLDPGGREQAAFEFDGVGFKRFEDVAAPSGGVMRFSVTLAADTMRFRLR